MPNDFDTPRYYAQARELPEAGAPITNEEILHGYRIEARTIRPGQKVQITLGPTTLDNSWRALPLSAGEVRSLENVEYAPNSVVVPVPGWARDMEKHGILPYAAAQAHRWGFHSAIACGQPGLCNDIETRLVLVTFKHTFEIVEVGVTDGVTQYDAEMDHIPLRERAPHVPEETSEAASEAPVEASPIGSAFANLGEDVYDAADAAMTEFLAQEGSESADLAEEPAPKAKGKSKPKAVSAGAKPERKKKG